MVLVNQRWCGRVLPRTPASHQELSRKPSTLIATPSISLPESPVCLSRPSLTPGVMKTVSDGSDSCYDLYSKSW